MGIKDRVINILFDEDELGETSNTTKMTRSKHEDTSSFTVDTAPVFIDVNPIKTSKKEETKINENINEIVKEIKQEESYRMTENISPIFGVQKNESRSRKASQKNRVDNNQKMYDGLLNAGINVGNTNYSSVIISPIFGPLDSKQTRKNPTRTNKKKADPFARNIDDTGEFKTLYAEGQEDNKEELEFEPEAPAFEDVKEEKIVDEKLGDTDRLSKISDRINQIKNEAAHIYSEPAEHIEPRHDTAKPEVHNTISDLIHNFQKEDFTPDFSVLNRKQETTEELPPIIETEKNVEEVIEPIEEEVETVKQDIIDDTPVYDTEPSFVNEEIEPADTFEDVKSEPVQLNLEDTFSRINEKIDETPSSSIDDIFDDDVEEGKDLFSDLFGDE